MNEITRFRTAIGGFNRSDVASYIEQSASAHREKVKTLEGQIVKLQNEAISAMNRINELEAQLAEKDAQLETAQRASELVSQIRRLLESEE
ncbi:MAG: hypothetical protein IJT07_03780 [Oscillospiraceae bacterium]|nr:hypothetical protein [Oscillospiraceae bacterium]